ncbi:Hypothetical predicted protein, partial [Marmota monax]
FPSLSELIDGLWRFSPALLAPVFPMRQDCVSPPGFFLVFLIQRHFSVTACLVPICSLYGTAVTTVEGIGSIKTRLHPVQERTAKSHGTQCGFCTPGMVMSMYALLRNHLHPSEEQLMEALG